MGGQPKSKASSLSSAEVGRLWQLTGLFLTLRDKKREREKERKREREKESWRVLFLSVEFRGEEEALF